jgi:predicted transcriptional regulator
MDKTVDMDKRTQIVLAWELAEEGVPQTHIAQRLGVHRETVGQWLKGSGSRAFERKVWTAS